MLAGCAQLPFWPFDAQPDPAAVREAFLKGEQAVLDKDYAAAAAAFERAIETDPDSVDAMLWLGRCQLLLGNGDAAVSTLKNAHDRAPGRADVLRYLAKALSTGKDLAAAEAAYLSLKELDPNDPTIYAGLEKIYTAMGDAEKLNALRGVPLDTPIGDGTPSDDDWQPASTEGYDDGQDSGSDDGAGWATIPPELLVTPPADSAPAQTPEPEQQPTPTPYVDPNMPQVEDEAGWDEYGG